MRLRYARRAKDRVKSQEVEIIGFHLLKFAEVGQPQLA